MPKDIAALRAIDQDHRRGGSGYESRAKLEDELRTGVPLSIKSEYTGQSARGREAIDAGGKRKAPKVLPREIGSDGEGDQCIVSSLYICIGCDCSSIRNFFSVAKSGWEASDGSAWRKTDESVDDCQSGICYRRRGEHTVGRSTSKGDLCVCYSDQRECARDSIVEEHSFYCRKGGRLP